MPPKAKAKGSAAQPTSPVKSSSKNAAGQPKKAKSDPQKVKAPVATPAQVSEQKDVEQKDVAAPAPVSTNLSAALEGALLQIEELKNGRDQLAAELAALREAAASGQAPSAGAPSKVPAAEAEQVTGTGNAADDLKAAKEKAAVFEKALMKARTELELRKASIERLQQENKELRISSAEASRERGDPRVKKSEKQEELEPEGARLVDAHRQVLINQRLHSFDMTFKLQRCAKQFLKLKRGAKSGAPKPARRKSLVVQGEVPENRFQMSASVFTMKYLSLETFFGGLELYIGTPSPDILNSMEREHSSTEPFNSHNVFGTSPRDEWLYVVTAEVGTRKDRMQDATPQRFLWHLDDFWQSDTARSAKLLREEVIGLRL